MRLVAWNANHNNKRRTLEQNVELLSGFHADLLVVSETAAPSAANPTGALWTGNEGWPGLAVVAGSGIELTPHAANPLSPPLMAGYRVAGRVELNLLAVWPVQHKGGPTYSQILESALEQYADLLSAQAVLAGDLNSNTSVSGQQKSHPRFVSAAGDMGLASVYHHQAGEAHGAESLHTYRHSASKAFHIDYCFVSRPLLECANLGIASGNGWSDLSDHSPVILDLPDAVLEPL